MTLETTALRARRRLISAAAALSALLAGAAALAQNSAFNIYSGVSPGDIAAVIRNNGVTAGVIRDENGEPFIAGEFRNGLKFGVFFYYCESDWTGCERYQYVLYYTRDANVPFEQVNGYNDYWIYGKVSIQTGDPRKLTLFFSDYLTGGVTGESINRTFRLWGGVVESFKEHFGITSYPGQLMAGADGEDGAQIAATAAAAPVWNASFSADEDIRSKILNNFSSPRN